MYSNGFPGSPFRCWLDLRRGIRRRCGAITRRGNTRRWNQPGFKTKQNNDTHICIAPHRRWMPESNPADNGSRYRGTRCSTTRPTEVYLECRNQYGLTAPLRGPRGATPETRPPGPPCWPPTPDQTVRGFKFLFWCSSGELHLCTTSWWGDPYGDRTGGPTPRRCREARHIPLRDLFYPDMLP